MISLLVLLSALLHAGWNALLRVQDDKDRSLVAAMVFATGFAAIVAGVRFGLEAAPFMTPRGLGFALAAGVFEASYFMTLVAGLERGTLGTVYTISRGGAVLVVWPLSIAIFSEVATPAAIAGSALVLGGLVLSGTATGGSRTGNQRGAIGWAVACALSIAGYHLSYKAALREAVNPSACFAVALSVSAAINVARLGRPGRGALRALIARRWPVVVVMGIGCAGSFLLLMEALAIGGSGFVLTLRNTSVLFAAAMAWLIGERPTWPALAGAALVAGGAAVMAG